MNNNRILSLTAALVLAQCTFAIDVKTDRTWYLAGEAMKVSVTADAVIAYAELCDTYGMAAGVVIGLQEGRGTGMIELSSNLHSGYYVLSAYTRDKAQVSRQLVAVVNPLHKHEDDDIEWVKIAHPDSLSYLSSDPFPLEQVVKATSVREAEGHVIRARVRNVCDGNTFSGNQIRPSLAIIGKQIHYFEGRMMNDSIAVFYTYGVHGKRPLVLSAVSTTGVSLPVELISPFANLIPKRLPHLVFHYNRSEVEARSIDMQRHQMAIAPAKREIKIGDDADDTAVEGVPLDYDETIFGTRPDLTYNLDEYRQFFTVKEVLLEYVNCVTTRKVNDVLQLMVRKEQGSYDSSWPTMVFIDGMPVVNVERLLDYDARRVHYINIYSGQYTFGNGIYNGILSFVTRSGRLTNYPVEHNAQYLVYEFPQ